MARSGKKWNVNEILSLQREYELLQMNIDDIAKKHKRTPKAIVYKLQQEGFAKFDWLQDDYEQVVVASDSQQDVVLSDDSQQDVVLLNQGIALHCPGLGLRPNVLFESGFPPFGKTIISFILQKIWIPFVKSVQKF